MPKTTTVLALALIAFTSACSDESSEDPHGAGGSAGATGGGAVGSACSSASDCPAGGSGSPVCRTDWPSGYCAVADCSDHGHDCPNDPGLGSTATTGGKCVLAPTAMCLALCASDADCRDGYECVPKSDAAGHATADVCFPKATGSGGAGGAGSGGMGTGGGMMDGGMMDGGM